MAGDAQCLCNGFPTKSYTPPLPFCLLCALSVLINRYACRSDPVLQHGDHGHGSSSTGQQQQQPLTGAIDRQLTLVPPSDGGCDIVRPSPGSGVVREGSTKSLVSCYENHVQEVAYFAFIPRSSAVTWGVIKFVSET